MPNNKKPDHLKRIRVNTRQPALLINELVEKTGLSVTESVELSIRGFLALDEICDQKLIKQLLKNEEK